MHCDPAQPTCPFIASLSQPSTQQIDYILRRLLTINERIDDTEDLVAIKMDHRR